MKLGPLALAFASVVALAAPARAQDAIHTCIAASTDGQTLRKQGKLLAARAAMVSCARDSCPAVVRSHCARWLSEVDAQIPSIVVRAQDAAGNDVLDARVAIDGRPAKLDGHPVQLDPGDHAIAIDASRGHHLESRVLVVEGEASRIVTLRFPETDHPAPAAKSDAVDSSSASPTTTPGTSHIPAGAWILGGIGVASLAASGVFALVAKSDLNTLDSTCSPHCTSAQTQTGRTHALLADVFLGAGAVGVGGAVVWALAFPSHSEPSRVGGLPALMLTPLPGGASAALRISY